MAIETVFLVVLLIALVAGHFFLEITKPKKEQLFQVSGETQKLLMPSETISSAQLSPVMERLDKLEKLLLSFQNNQENQPLSGRKIENGLQKKIESLVDFRNEIRIEVAALKGEIRAIKEFIGFKEKNSQVFEIPSNKLHELAYNVRK